MHAVHRFARELRPAVLDDLLAKGADLLVCEATYLHSEETEAHAHYHMTATQSATLAHNAQARRLVLTHFSQRYVSLEPFVHEARAVFADVGRQRHVLRGLRTSIVSLVQEVRIDEITHAARAVTKTEWVRPNVVRREYDGPFQSGSRPKAMAQGHCGPGRRPISRQSL